MNTDLKDYVKVYSLIDKDICNKTIKQLENVTWDHHRFYSASGVIDNGKEPYEYHGNIETKSVLQESIWLALKKYVLEDINFPWFPGWQGFSNLKFIKYPPGTKMEKHCDHIHSLYDGVHKGIPILTVIGVLNDDFTGGEFVLFDDYKLDLQQGDIIVFPSVFLFPHAINEVISGTRYSVISWSN